MAKRKNPPAKAANVKTKNTPISKGTKPMCASKKRNLRSIVQPQQADKKYEVEAILDSRKRKSKTEYLVKWKNYNKSWNTWEPSTSFSDSKVMIEEFKAKKLAAKAEQKKKRKVSVATMTEPIPEPPPPVPLVVPDDVEILIPVSPALLIEPDEPVPAAPPAPPAPPAPRVNANANQRPRQNWDEWLRNANNLLRPQRQIPLIVLDSSDESDYDDLESVEDLMQDLDDALRGVMRVDRSTTPEEDRALSVAASYSSVSEEDQPDPNPAPASSPSPQNQPTVVDMALARLGRGAVLLEGLLENGSIFAADLQAIAGWILQCGQPIPSVRSPSSSSDSSATISRLSRRRRRPRRRNFQKRPELQSSDG